MRNGSRLFISYTRKDGCVLAVQLRKDLPFAVFDLQTVFWDSAGDLKTGELPAHVSALAKKHGK